MIPHSLYFASSVKLLWWLPEWLVQFAIGSPLSHVISTSHNTRPLSQFRSLLLVNPTESSHLSPTMRRLPPELWLHIFDALCHIPASLETQDHKIIEAYSEDVNGIILHNQIASLTQTKLALSSVCWSWRNLALPFLFREILIRSGRHAAKLATTLKELKQCKTAQGLHFPGCWIKRIEVLSDIKYWDEDGHEALTMVLENASNLVVFSDAFCTVPSNLVSHTPLIKQLSSLCISGSLRRLEWYCDTPTTLELVLKGTPCLEVLILCRGHITSNVDQAITLPCLRILSIGPYVGLTRFSFMDAPCLESVLLYRSIVTVDCEAFLRWLTSCGSLRHLRVPSTDVRHMMGPNETSESK